jgi:DNA mismatch repair protein MutS2
MQERNLRVLEFTKIREMLAALAVSELGRERIGALVPSSDASTVLRWQQETDEASTIVAYTGGNPMSYFTDIRDHLKRAAIGAVLSPKGLLEVAGVMSASRAVRNALVTERENTPLITDMA